MKLFKFLNKAKVHVRDRRRHNRIEYSKHVTLSMPLSLKTAGKTSNISLKGALVVDLPEDHRLKAGSEGVLHYETDQSQGEVPCRIVRADKKHVALELMGNKATLAVDAAQEIFAERTSRLRFLMPAI